MLLMLRDNVLNISAALPTWGQFKPTTTKDILAHYYASSSGTISNGFIKAVSISAGIIAGFFGVDPKAVQQAIDKTVAEYRAELQKMMQGSTRAKIDSKAEKARIVSVYLNYYNSPGNTWMQTFINKTPAEIRTAAITLKNTNLLNAKKGCETGNTAACRWEGLINCQIEYLTLLAALKENAGTNTPGQPTPPPKTDIQGSTEAKKLIPIALASYLLFNF
jgi:hypothetical protein